MERYMTRAWELCPLAHRRLSLREDSIQISMQVLSSTFWTLRYAGYAATHFLGVPMRGQAMSWTTASLSEETGDVTCSTWNNSIYISLYAGLLNVYDTLTGNISGMLLCAGRVQRHAERVAVVEGVATPRAFVAQASALGKVRCVFDCECCTSGSAFISFLDHFCGRG